MRVLIITGSRADWSGLGEVAVALREAGQDVKFCIGGHWKTPDAHTALEAAGFEWSGSYLLPSTDPNLPHPAKAIAGFAVAATADACRFMAIDLAVVCGDRSEVLASALGCHLQGIPIAHIAGGDVTLGSADNRMRDAITMLASMHFPTHAGALDRLINRLGVDGRNVFQFGSPAVDRLLRLPRVSREIVFAPFGLDPSLPTLMVSVHPATVPDAPDECGEILHALVDLEHRFNETLQIVVTEPNGDDGSRKILNRLMSFADPSTGLRRFVRNLPPDNYIQLLASCDAMLGNSSAGVYEAPVLGVPSVIVGDRQAGRPTTAWGYVKAERLSISAVAYNAVIAGRARRTEPCTIFGDGTAARKIAETIAATAKRVKPYGRDCLAADIPGATCQLPQCDC